MKLSPWLGALLLAVGLAAAFGVWAVREYAATRVAEALAAQRAAQVAVLELRVRRAVDSAAATHQRAEAAAARELARWRALARRARADTLLVGDTLVVVVPGAVAPESLLSAGNAMAAACDTAAIACAGRIGVLTAALDSFRVAAREPGRPPARTLRWPERALWLFLLGIAAAR